MSAIHSLAVFCGSRVGINPAYAEAGRFLGHGLAAAGIRLVYGGGRIGIMGDSRTLGILWDSRDGYESRRLRKCKDLAVPGAVAWSGLAK